MSSISSASKINNPQIPIDLTKEKSSQESKTINFAKKYFSNTSIQLILIALAAGVVFTPIAVHFAIPTAITLCVNGLALSAMANIAIRHKKELDYELSFLDSVIRSKLMPEKWTWYTKLDENIFLGAMPLNNRHHLKELIKKTNGKLAILSTLEKWEMEKLTPFTHPVTPKDWETNNVEQLVIETKDHSPLSLENLEKGVKFIQKQIAEGKKVYIHCKAGKGRSASTVACYYMVKNHWTPKQAIEFIKNKRSIITLQKKSRQERLQEFYEQILPKIIEENKPFYKKILRKLFNC